MAKNKTASSSLFGVLSLAAIGAVIIGTVAGVKYVIDEDIFGKEQSSIVPISSSDNTDVSTSNISEEPPISSEDQRNEFPAPLFEDDSRSIYTIDIKSEMKPENMSASAYQEYRGVIWGHDGLNDINLPIIANSIRYVNSGSALGSKFRLGFNNNTLLNRTEEAFYDDYSYASSLILDFSLKGGRCLVQSELNFHDAFALFYRTSLNTNWSIADYTVNNAVLFNEVRFDPEEYYQLAFVFRTNNKTNNLSLRSIAIENYSI